VPEEYAEERDYLHDVAHEHDDRVGGSAQSDVGLIDELRGDFARRVLLIGRRRPMEHALEELGAKRHEYRLRDLRHQDGAHDGRHGIEERHTDQGRWSREDHPLLILVEAEVRELTQERSREGRHACRPHQEDAGQGNLPLVG